MISLIANWRIILLVGLIAAVPAAFAIGKWQGGAETEARLRAEAAEARLVAIEEERNRRDEVQTLDADDLHERLREWVLR